MTASSGIEYETIVWPLSLLIFARCKDYGDGIPDFEHLAENDLQEPSDILCRLGLMTDRDGRGHRHVFARNWVPKKPLDLFRHPGEPTILDLILALCFLVDWDSHRFGDVRRINKRELNDLIENFDPQSDEWGEMSPRYKFHESALFTGCSVLEDLGLGSWVDKVGFKVVEELSEASAIRVMDIYRQSRWNISNQLGGEDKLYPSKKQD
ncbi:hypothetical protein [Stappia sp.]|uniref:hypothetical protein n=1 Tax=Stappia sp. TaxID=1870903 RepID=UPI003A99F498